MIYQKSQWFAKHHKATNGLIFLSMLVIVGLLFFLESPALGLPWTDSSVFLYIGQRIIKGDVPYLDVWDHNPPLIY